MNLNSDKPCPYLGIRPFQYADSNLFHGREDTVNKLVDLLAQQHFVTVVAPSGYGKSSLVKAGFIPDLEAGKMDAHVDWCIVDCRPGLHPFTNLAEQLLENNYFKQLYAPDKDRKQVVNELTRELKQTQYGLTNIVDIKLKPKGFKLFLLIDQFEEVFRFHQNASEESKEINNFVQLLLTCSQHPNIYIVLTMRLEFLGDCARFLGLPEVINRGFFLLPRLTQEQLSEVIENPARQFNGTIRVALLDKLQEEMRYHPERLPLLQHVLMRMWKVVANKPTNSNVSNIELTLNHYNRIGEMQALSLHADDIYEELKTLKVMSGTQEETIDAQGVAEILFKQLTGKRCDDQYVRRPCLLGEITALDKISEAVIIEVIEQFAKAGNDLLRVDRSDPLNWFIDITHESLISQWSRLRQWADDEAEMAKMYRDLEKGVQAWESWRKWDKGNTREPLLEGNELQKALLWLDTNPIPTTAWAKRYGDKFDLVQQFLAASKTTADEAKKRKNREIIDSAKLDHKKRGELQKELVNETAQIGDDKLCCWRWLWRLFSVRLGRSTRPKKNQGLDQNVK